MADLSWLTEFPIAHRGFHDIAEGIPENSLAAFAAAREAGFAIECDLRFSSDRRPMVFHDATLDRMTSEVGPVAAIAAEKLSAIRLQDTAETIPTLEELLELVSGAVPIVLEMKSTKGHDEGFATAVAACLQSYSGPVAAMSFDHGLLRDMKSAAPGLPLGLTAEGGLITATWHMKAILGTGVHFISYGIQNLPTPLPLFARYVLGLKLICWTVRTPAERKRARRWTQQMTFEGFHP